MITSSCYIQESLSDSVIRRCLRKINTTSTSINSNCGLLASTKLLTNTISSNSSAITCVGSSNSGLSPTISISSISNDIYGRISITIDNSPSGLELCKITLTKKYNFCICNIYPFNSTLANNYDIHATIDNSGSYTVINVALNTLSTSSQQLIFNYVVFGK